jgi:excisionase family DNA binding protein
MAGDAETTGPRPAGGAPGGAEGSHKPLSDAERLLTPAEVAAMFRVDPKTVTRWARDGRLTAVRTLGGHRRYLESEVLGLLRAARSAGGL